MVAEMGGLAEKQISDSIAALAKRDTERARRVIESRCRDRRVAARDRGKGGAHHRAPPADGGRSARDRGRAARRQRSRADRRPRQEYRQARRSLTGRFPPAETHPRRRAHGAPWCCASSRRCSTAYASRDLQKALAVWKGDEEVDAICTSLFRELLTYMMEDPRNITFCIHLMFCAKNIERMGDHATNIAETVHYMIEGHDDRRPAAEGRYHDLRRRWRLRGADGGWR